MIWIRRILLTYVFLAVFAAATGFLGAAPPTPDAAAFAGLEIARGPGAARPGLSGRASARGRRESR